MNPPPSDPDLFVSFRDCHLLILKMVQGHSGLGSTVAMHHVTRILLGAREDIKYSPRAIILLIGMQIVDMKLMDEYLAKVSYRMLGPYKDLSNTSRADPVPFA